jgi:predicted nucleic acid-binding protein
VSLVYVDSSALIKLLILESESATVLEALNEHLSDGSHIATSALAKIELNRVRVRIDRSGPAEARFTVEDVDAILDSVALIQITDEVLDDASKIEHHVKSLDAIHVATAMQLRDELSSVITFDENMRQVGQLLKLPVTNV